MDGYRIRMTILGVPRVRGIKLFYYLDILELEHISKNLKSCPIPVKLNPITIKPFPAESEL